MNAKRDVIHISLNEELNFTTEDMQRICTLFLEANKDPKGSVIATVGGVECKLETVSVQEGEEINLVTVRFKEQVEVQPHAVREIWLVGRIEGNRIFSADDDTTYADVDEDFLRMYDMEQRGYLTQYEDGSHGFLVSGERA